MFLGGEQQCDRWLAIASSIVNILKINQHLLRRKEHKLCVTQKRVLEELELRGVLDAPRTKVAQNALLLELMLKEINSEGKV